MNIKKIFYLQYLISLNHNDIMLYDDYIVEDFEQEDMDNFYKEYPELKIIPFNTMLYLQRYYNSEMLSAGWCGATSPNNLIKFLERLGNKDGRKKNV